MAAYRYVSSAPATIMDSPYAFVKFGQLVDIPQEMAEKAMQGRVHIIPDKEFWEDGFTQDELKRYSRFETHANADPVFLAKLQNAWIRAQKLHQLVNQPAEAVEPLEDTDTTSKE